MKTKLLLTASLVVLLSCAQSMAGTDCANYECDATTQKKKVITTLGIGAGGEIPVYETTLPEVVSVTVNRHFVEKDEVPPGEPLSECTARAGRPNEADVKEYFALAWEITRWDYDKALSNYCAASGKLTFIDGTSGEWYINAAGRGQLKRKGAFPLFFYCPRCSLIFGLGDLDEKTRVKFGRNPEKDAFYQ